MDSTSSDASQANTCLLFERTIMKQATLKMKLLLGFGLLIASLAASSIFNYLSIERLSTFSRDYEDATEKENLVQRMRGANDNQRNSVQLFLLSGRNAAQIEDSTRQFQDAAGKLSALIRLEEGKRLLAEVLQAHAEYSQQMDQFVRMRQSGQSKEALARFDEPKVHADQEAVETSIAALKQLEERVKQQTLEQRQATDTRVRWLLVSLAMLGMVCGISVAVYLSSAFTERILAIVELAQEVAANNLSATDLRVTSQDELGRASRALNTMKNNLRGLVESIARTAEHVASASEELSSSATQQAQSAETQKGQATQVGVAMQEMSATVRDVSDNSNRATEASSQAAETARRGGAIVEESLAKMRAIAESVNATARKVEELGKSSDQIGRIIGVIDDIADQTNLLALNAAIEAARAGEQGRGFAVVADEVRKLAERTTSATKEVAQMVQGIQTETTTAVAAMHDGSNQVQDGLQITARAGDSLKEIIHMAEQVGEMITHIATAANQQSSATEQVNQNVEQITRLVSESALGAQQSAKACQDLSELALDLQRMVGEFRLETGTAGESSASRVQGRREGISLRKKAYAVGA